MSKYQSYRKREAPHRDRYAVHPIWRGVGCLFAVIIPIVSFFISSWVINANQVAHWFTIPKDFIFTIKNIQMEPLLPTKLLGTVAISFVLYLVMLLVTYLTDTMVGVDRLGPTDAPPERYVRRRPK